MENFHVEYIPLHHGLRFRLFYGILILKNFQLKEKYHINFSENLRQKSVYYWTGDIKQVTLDT